MTALLSVRDLSKSFQTRHGIIQAVNSVSFEVAAGETVALVGESGCGKSTVALTLLGLLERNEGEVVFEGSDITSDRTRRSASWRQRLSIVFQNPYSSLDPRMRIRDIVGEPLVTAYGLSGQALAERVTRHLSEVGLGPEHLMRYPHEFSGGQRQRIAIARAVALEPRLLILDEPTAALDVSVQAQVLNLLQDLQRKHRLSYLFISHNLATVESIADRVLIMYLGRLVESGPVADVFADPRHPYTKGLLDSVPSIDPRHRGRLKPLTGELPSALNPPSGCPFAPRCSRVSDRCRVSPPPLIADGPDRSYACLDPIGLDLVTTG